jgi:acetylornithine deacetylase/succinyl-diaminopimelate desuccinylase-like protein
MAQSNGNVKAALDHLEGHFDDFKTTLVELSRIPSVSAEGFAPAEVRRSADAVAAAMRQAGIENVEVLEIPGVHPYVYGDWLHRPEAPTILLYGHHDVQPPGRPEKWLSPAFEPTERKGRLYGRGTADDKAGVMAHVAAVASYLKSSASIPCNVKFLIEGEEEIGSENLGKFLEKYKSKMSADFIVLSDTANFDTGVPALTYQLRGICQVDLEVQCLDHPLHSGMWGGPVPDPVQILCGIIADLRKKDGRSTSPALRRRGQALRSSSASASLRREQVQAGGGLVKGMKLAGRRLLLREAVDPASAHDHRHGVPRDPGLFQPDRGLGAARLRCDRPQHGPGRKAASPRQEADEHHPTARRSPPRSTARHRGGRPIPKGRPSRPPGGRSRPASARTRP